MNSLFKKIAICAAAASIVATMGAGVLAQTEMSNMVFEGYYDLREPLAPNRIYNEVVNGVYTGKQILEPVTPEWRVEGYEGVYPYAGYSRMYLDGNRQEITAYNNTFPQWQTRRKDYMWELKKTTKTVAPNKTVTGHIIYERQQTYVPGKGWTWDYGNEYFNIPDSALLTRTNRFAVLVKEEMKEYGFGARDINGQPLTASEVKMYNDFGVGSAITTWNNLLATTFTPESLSARDINNRYIITDAEIKDLVPVVYSNYITAKLNDYDDEGLMTKSVAAEYLAHMNDGWAWDYDTSFCILNNAEISWTAPTFEMADPYRLYQCLVINGVAMDGTNGKDYIYRYTGGLATPEVKWNFWGYEYMLDENGNEIKNIFEVVEQKFLVINGVEVPATDANGNYIYRNPTGEYGKVFFKVVGNTIECWVTDKYEHTNLVATAQNWDGTIGGLIDAFYSVPGHYIGIVDEVQGKKLP